MSAGPQVPDPAEVAAAIAEAGRIEREQANAVALANWHASGEFERGYQQCIADQQAEAEEIARQLAADVGLMERRWGPGGRENFGAPRAGDFRGTDRAAVAFRRPGQPAAGAPAAAAAPSHRA